MATKCVLNINDLTNDLWDTMQQNKAGSLDNDRAKAQAAVAGKILKGKADQLRHKKLTNKPKGEIQFYLE